MVALALQDNKYTIPKNEYSFVEIEPKEYKFSFGGVDISVTREGHVTIDNAKSITFKGDEINLDGKKVNVHASEEYNLNVDGDIYMGSSAHLIMQSKRIDHNPRIMHSGYNLKVNIKEYIDNGYSDDGAIHSTYWG